MNIHTQNRLGGVEYVRHVRWVSSLFPSGKARVHGIIERVVNNTSRVGFNVLFMGKPLGRGVELEGISFAFWARIYGGYYAMCSLDYQYPVVRGYRHQTPNILERIGGPPKEVYATRRSIAGRVLSHRPRRCARRIKR